MGKTKIEIKNLYGKKRYYVSATTSKEVYLTDKEAGIVNFLIAGLRPKEIAWKLTASLNTVNTHLANIKIKLGCINSFQLGLVLGNAIALDSSIFKEKLIESNQ
jgi:DNA-binding CsgD family transcriptional regulator